MYLLDNRLDNNFPLLCPPLFNKIRLSSNGDPLSMTYKLNSMVAPHDSWCYP